MRFPLSKSANSDVCGVEYETADGRGMILHNHTGSALAKGQPVQVNFASVADVAAGDAGGGTYKPILVQAAAPATNTTVLKTVAIAEEAVANHGYGRFRVTGYVDALCYTVAVGDALEVLNGGTYLVVDGTTGTNTETVETVGIALEANTDTAAALCKILLKGEPCQIQAA